jgi:hypothetical protein
MDRDVSMIIKPPSELQEPDAASLVFSPLASGRLSPAVTARWQQEAVARYPARYLRVRPISEPEKRPGVQLIHEGDTTARSAGSTRLIVLHHRSVDGPSTSSGSP